MGLLDKLKPQPRWKHTDPAVRLEAVKDVTDAVDLVQLAEGDPDGRVRRAAVARLDDAAVLGRIAERDPDPETRDRAADRLMLIASQVPSGAGAPDTATAQAALQAARAITDPRRLSTLAKGQASDAVRDYALTRIQDVRALGSIARHAKSESTARAALARVDDQDELLEIALHSDHRDVALAAFDRLPAASLDLAALRSIEVRSQQKAVSRRARTMIQEIEAAEAARQTAALERQRRESMLCEAVEQLVEVTDPVVMRAELSRLSEAWLALEATEPTNVERFTRAATAVEAAIHRREREAEEAADRQRLRAEAIATRIALCERVETLDGEDVLAQLVPIEEEWRSLLPLVDNGPEADRLAERFAQAVAACRKRHEMGALLHETRAALEARVVEAEGLVSADDAAGAEAAWQSLDRDARGLASILESAGSPAPELIARLEAVGQAFAGRQAERDAAAAQAREAALQQLTRMVERARRVAEAESITLREGDRLIRDITAAIDQASRIGGSKEIEAATAELRALQAAIAPRVHELREMDEWRRFANAQRQEQLITMAEAIVTSLKEDELAGKQTDLEATARALRELHAEWQKVAEGPRQNAQRLWERFRSATDVIRSRCEPYFAKRREERQTASARREAIVAEAESLATSTDWTRTAARIQELQKEWQALGRPAGEKDRELFQRFRTASNTFFARRREDLTDRKKVWAENLAAKEALCARAEELAASTDWDQAAAEMKKLQAQWKTIGPVRKNKSDAIWTRFRAAADRFFERYHNRHEIALAGKLAEREAVVAELEALVAIEGDLPATAAEDVQRLRTTWNRSVPVPVPGMKVLNERWRRALGQLLSTRAQLFAGTDLDPQVIVQRMEKLVARLEGLLADKPKEQETAALSPTEQLAARLRQAFASNAMGRPSEARQQKASAETLREVQAAWQRLPSVDLPEAKELEARYREACRQLDGGRRHGGPSQHRRQRPAQAEGPENDQPREPEPAAV
jgi:hypothetical protein